MSKYQTRLGALRENHTHRACKLSLWAQDNISVEKSSMDTEVMYLLHVFWE